MGELTVTTIHVARAGDCISSLAERYGIPAKLIWDHESNQSLRKEREDPNVLFPGDRVCIPNGKPRKESRATEKSHRFALKKELTVLKVQLLVDFEPIANRDCELWIEGKAIEGVRTDSEGWLTKEGDTAVAIPSDAESASLTVYDVDGQPDSHYELHLGHLDPVKEIEGVQQRLGNLGFDAGPADGKFGPRTSAAIASYQRVHHLSVNGQVDAATEESLRSEHRS